MTTTENIERIQNTARQEIEELKALHEAGELNDRELEALRTETWRSYLGDLALWS